ncbi:hypothetical protein C0992_006954, partial [Termitomyces sp. T32_za158]
MTSPGVPMNSPPQARTSASLGSAKPAGKLEAEGNPETRNVHVRHCKSQGLQIQ